MRNVYKKMDDATYFFVSASEEHLDYPANKGMNNNRLTRSSFKKSGVIRALCNTTIKLSRRRESETNVEYLTHFDIGGSDKAGHLIDFFLHKKLKSVVAMQQYFQKLRPLDVLDEIDGKAIGIAFNIQRKIQRKNAGMRERWNGVHIKRSVAIVMKDHRALREFVEIYPWCIELMEGILNNHLLMVPPVVKSKMLNLSKKEAYIIGRKLAKTLKGQKTAEAGVDQWMLAHPAMIEMGREYPFFIPMIIVIGRQKVIDAPWEMKFRVYVGAFLSILGKLSTLFLFSKDYFDIHT